MEAGQELLGISFCCYTFLAMLNLLSGLAHYLLTPLFMVLSDSLFFLVTCVVEVAMYDPLASHLFYSPLCAVAGLGTWNLV